MITLPLGLGLLVGLLSFLIYLIPLLMRKSYASRRQHEESEELAPPRRKGYDEKALDADSLRRIRSGIDSTLTKQPVPKDPLRSLAVSKILFDRRHIPEPVFPKKPSEFRHKPLNEDEIRLLEVLPSTGQEEVHCELHHFRLSRIPAYAAISYQWGSRDSDNKVSIDSGVYRVLENAAHALRQLRDAAVHKYIWIDCICIDQSNDAEKSEQVALMSEIFSQAEEIVVWLGKEDLSMEIAFASLVDFASLDEPRKSDVDKVCEDIAPLLENRYWTRLWIIQELTMGISLVLMCGCHRLPWRYVENLIQRSRAYMAFTYYARGARRENCIRAIDIIHRIITSRTNLATPGRSLASLPLGVLLYDCRHSCCSDPRDKIFGLLSIYNATHRVEKRRELQPDYSASRPHLVILYTAHILEDSPERDHISVVRFLTQLLELGPHAKNRLPEPFALSLQQRKHQTSLVVRFGNEIPVNITTFNICAVEISRINSVMSAGSIPDQTFLSPLEPLLVDALVLDHLNIHKLAFESDWMNLALQHWKELQINRTLLKASCGADLYFCSGGVRAGDILCRPFTAGEIPDGNVFLLVLRELPSKEMVLVGTAVLSESDGRKRNDMSAMRGFVIPVEPVLGFALAANPYPLEWQLRDAYEYLIKASVARGGIAEIERG